MNAGMDSPTKLAVFFLLGIVLSSYFQLFHFPGLILVVAHDPVSRIHEKITLQQVNFHPMLNLKN